MPRSSTSARFPLYLTAFSFVAPLLVSAACAPSREEEMVLREPMKIAMMFGPHLRLPDQARLCKSRLGVHRCPKDLPLRGIYPVEPLRNASCLYEPNGPPIAELDENGVPQGEYTLCCALTYFEADRRDACSR
ncbi:hypothetical protein [Polyangium jinanense]|uniref:Secreted protein n=1 Tax=Polyangium jinanense TaxID=2829994 RepID=A0A9X3X8B4_9BACT|nr:hypothetical protein [Polyangium jinanense]MDC3959044.1 hypothetical protein [Polyangium jinanense]MDC3984033.1 hypothetical protein [Polyangium jinanense]